MNPATRYSAKQALEHPWLRGHTSSTIPLPDGHAQRLLAYKRLQKLRANILTVIMSLPRDHSNDDANNDIPTAVLRMNTMNMDMFREAFALFDKDESGDIDKSELSNLLVALGQHVSSKDINAMMHEADIDGDGKISFLEFVSLMNKRLFQRGQLRDADLQAAFNVRQLTINQCFLIDAM